MIPERYFVLGKKMHSDEIITGFVSKIVDGHVKEIYVPKKNQKYEVCPWTVKPVAGKIINTWIKPESGFSGSCPSCGLTIEQEKSKNYCYHCGMRLQW